MNNEPIFDPAGLFKNYKKCPKCTRCIKNGENRVLEMTYPNTFTKIIKTGKIKGKQRFKCKKCNYSFTSFYRKEVTEIPMVNIRKVLHLYIENISLKDIGDIYGVSSVTILKRIKKSGIDTNIFKKIKEKSKLKINNNIDMESNIESITNEIYLSQNIDNEDWIFIKFGEKIKVITK